jgi:imidazole glycerol-phosphate synthase subunit HisH
MTARQGHIALVDYGMGNRRSVFKALERVGARPVLTSAHKELVAAHGLVIPGVGAFPEAMKRLAGLELTEPIRERALEGVPVLGICLGMQLLFDRSLEMGDTAGLGLIPGQVTPLHPGGLRVPHIGWSEVELVAPSPLTDGLAASAFYHVHSLAARPESPQDVLAVSEYGERFATIVGRGAVFGVQFHPEKSSAAGLALLERFVELCDGHEDRPPTPVTGAARQ